MANNDRLANGGNLGDNPGWMPDADIRGDTPLLTQSELLGPGWNTSYISRIVMTKDNLGLPGWRTRIFVPENLAQITLNTEEVVVTDVNDNIIPSGSYVEKGTTLRIHQNLGVANAKGCWATVRRQDTTDLSFWFTNYVDNYNSGHTFKSWVISRYKYNI